MQQEAANMARKAAPSRSSATKRILAIDIGGTGLKAAVDRHQTAASSPSGCGSRRRMHRRPKEIVPALVDLVAPLKGYDHVSIGFPGYVRDGKVFTAPNLGTKAWAGFQLGAGDAKKNWESPRGSTMTPMCRAWR